MLGRADAKMSFCAKHWAVTGPGSLVENQLAIVLQFLREVELNDSMLMRPYLTRPGKLSRRLAARLLRRHVCDGADRGARAGERDSKPWAHRGLRRRRLLLRVSRARSPTAWPVLN